MPKTKKTKVKEHFSIDIKLSNEITKKAKKMKLKRSQVVNEILHQVLIGIPTANELE